MWVGVLLSVFQFVASMIFYYSTSLWDSVGFGADAAFWISVVTAVVNILVTIVAIATVDRFGRWPPLLVGCAGMAVSLAVVTGCFWTANGGAAGSDNDLALGPVAGPPALVGANLFVVFFGMSWGPVVWVLLGGMFNNRFRAIALAVAAAAQWLANLVVTGTFPTLKGINVALPYLLFTTRAVLSFFLVAETVPETGGASSRTCESGMRVGAPSQASRRESLAGESAPRARVRSAPRAASLNASRRAERRPGHGGIRPGPPRGSPAAPDQRGPFPQVRPERIHRGEVLPVVVVPFRS